MSPRGAAGAVARVVGWALLLAVLAGLAERWWAGLGPVAAFRLHLGLASALLLAGALALRLWRAALPAAAALLLAGLTLGPVWAGPERPAAGPGRTVRLLFANVYMRNPDPAALEAALVAVGADVVVTAEAPRALIGGALDAAYPHRLLRPDPRHPVRAGIWSRFPLEAGFVNMNDNVAPVAARALLRLGPETRLGLVGLHLARAKTGKVEAQLDGLAALARPLGAPLAVVGDFNAAPWSRVVAEAAARTGTEAAAGFRVTWRGRYPLIGAPAVFGHQIDQLLVSAGVGIARLETVGIPGSDHLGLLAELVVPPAAALPSARPPDYVAPGTR